MNERMTLEEARALLHSAHGVTMSTDDPVLMLVTLHNAWLDQMEEQLAKHDAALASALGKALEEGRRKIAEEAQSLAGLANGATAKELGEVNLALSGLKGSINSATLCMAGTASALIFAAVLLAVLK
jgi:hypothetical protein